MLLDSIYVTRFLIYVTRFYICQYSIVPEIHVKALVSKNIISIVETVYGEVPYPEFDLSSL